MGETQRETERDRQRESERETETERDRERDRERMPTETVLQYPTLMRSSRRDHSIDVSDNIYECLFGLSFRCFFKIMNFSDRFRQFLKLFYCFEK